VIHKKIKYVALISAGVSLLWHDLHGYVPSIEYMCYIVRMCLNFGLDNYQLLLQYQVLVHDVASLKYLLGIDGTSS
jgi:hypothetical protein